MELKKLIYNGLCDGELVKIIQSYNDDCIACQIGDNWFYFIGSEYEDLTPDEVYETFTKEELTDMIYDAIIDLDKDEMLYYKYYLKENLE